VNQVHQLFIELAALVQLQGEMIDNIEINIRTAKDYVLVAEKDIIKSKENMQAARKKKCCILLIVLAVVIVIVAPVLGVKLGQA
jgi:t-SNARE complex subunit (syntaxin)